ncbi:spore germination protein KA [Natronobacillus azotifigens]|uniref:Spore germination protein n=1 Tax=Natronobacillus azotifigens TaxID=472978 RepID=A0A9J6R946_9BACI|nr:spore germination protein [Natronobacillus azotifigens]MCZ0702071.1 spore germination protein [Natronobacillus azotifigens]
MRLRSKKRTAEEKQKIIENISISDQAEISTSLRENDEIIRKMLGNSDDFISRKILLNKQQPIQVQLYYIDALVDKDTLQNDLLGCILNLPSKVDPSWKTEKDLYDFLQNETINTSDLTKIENLKELFSNLLSGDTIILIEGYSKAFATNTRGGQDRGVPEVTTQKIIRGPKEGFTERIGTNIGLVRRRIKDPNLWVKKYCIGEKTQTEVSIAYINGIVNDDIVKEVDQRLSRIEIDSILESGYIEQLIQDAKYSPFPTINNTERPDTIAAGLLEGRIAIFVDGSPFTLLVPALFTDFLQSSEDYYQRSDIGTLLRLLRTFAFFLAMMTPAGYIALTMFHQEMVPTTLLVGLAAQREGIPFPAFIEALIMEITFELLREAGVRLPSSVGSAISIVGALVLGQAAVEAGIVSSAMVIVVSLTAIASFVFPSYNLAITVRILRFGFMALAASFGFFGIFIGLILLVFHLVSLRSFGIPYTTPLAPFIAVDQKDVFVQSVLWKERTRPRLISQKNITRSKLNLPEAQKKKR